MKTNLILNRAVLFCGLVFSTFLLGCSGKISPSLIPTLPGSAGQSVPAEPQFTGPVTDFKLTCDEAQFVVLLNLYRVQNKLNAVAVSKNGVRAARWHTQDMIDKNYFSHTEPNGRDFSSRAGSFGYSAWAENIAAGYSDANGTFCQWKNSPGHNSNMLGSHQTIGLGRTAGGGTYGVYWCNNFGPSSGDELSSPLTADANCPMPAALPNCG